MCTAKLLRQPEYQPQNQRNAESKKSQSMAKVAADEVQTDEAIAATGMSGGETSTIRQGCRPA